MSNTGKASLRPQNGILSVAVRIFGFIVIFGFIGLIFAPMLMSENFALRSVLNIAVLSAAGMLFFQMGGAKGEDDCKSDFTRGKSQQGAPRVYSRGRTLAGTLVGLAPWIILGAAVAILAVPYTYTLQDLPSWLNAYMRQPDVGRALVYYNREIVTPIVDWLRIAVRFAILPFVYLIASQGDAASLLLDRIAPALMLALPACYIVGYLTGPSRFEKTRQFIESVKNKPRLRLKKNVRKQRQPRRDDRNQLI